MKRPLSRLIDAAGVVSAVRSDPVLPSTPKMQAQRETSQRLSRCNNSRLWSRSSAGRLSRSRYCECPQLALVWEIRTLVYIMFLHSLVFNLLLKLVSLHECLECHPWKPSMHLLSGVFNPITYLSSRSNQYNPHHSIVDQCIPVVLSDLRYECQGIGHWTCNSHRHNSMLNWLYCCCKAPIF